MMIPTNGFAIAAEPARNPAPVSGAKSACYRLLHRPSRPLDVLCSPTVSSPPGLARTSMAPSRKAKPRRSSGSSRPSFRRSRARFVLIANLILAVAIGGWYLVQPRERQAEVRLLVGNTFAENKRVSPWDVARDLYHLYYSPDFVTAPPPAGDRTHAFGDLPAGPPGETVRLLVNHGYLVGYSETRRNPLWAAYRSFDVPRLGPAPARPESFQPDPRTLARVDPSVYTNTGYDRGHLAPNYLIATRHGVTAQEETFLMSNVIPQRHELNAGLWRALELDIATSYPARFGEVWVIVGPVFAGPTDPRPRRLDRSGPEIPVACFKIILDESAGRIRTLAFLFPADTPRGSPIGNYLVTIDEIERRTGLDFFPALDSVTESTLESSLASSVW